MISKDLQTEVRRTWKQYGDAIVTAFRFPPGSHIVVSELEEIMGGMTDSTARQFIEYTNGRIAELENMKFVGEP